ncbi:rRNA maturation RNase YbeY [Methyloradius palustris]|uniref:Endoribonuclease YbeY n=1 Tax=Methyloradius palustris TaxID=2778876 RepID=A0A8D5G2D8_9PROT|nr:rRNA maturation RNase YbeY [Methyloradius palustris]BCM24420.1 endoribonuclease YbeY [Methyloradius palustris]
MPQLNLTVQNISVTSQIPSEADFKKWVKATIRVDTEATIRIVDEAEGRELNKAYRGKDYATNVLTFPLSEEPHLIGDIVICAPVVASEAASQNKALKAHFAHLTVHGVLHLHGYDHEIDAQAELMESIETEIVMKLGYPDPYLADNSLSENT